jgi:Cu+-exporting ATPase
MPQEKIILPISGMTCASCAMTIENALKKVDGVVGANVNFATEKATVEFDSEKADKAALIQAVESTGYNVDSEEE